MKKIIIPLTIAIIILFSLDLPAQTPPHPGGGSAPGSGAPPVGAPLDGGLSVLLLLGTAYASQKLNKILKN